MRQLVGFPKISFFIKLFFFCCFFLPESFYLVRIQNGAGFNSPLTISFGQTVQYKAWDITVKNVVHGELDEYLRAACCWFLCVTCYNVEIPDGLKKSAGVDLSSVAYPCSDFMELPLKNTENFQLCLCCFFFFILIKVAVGQHIHLWYNFGVSWHKILRENATNTFRKPDLAAPQLLWLVKTETQTNLTQVKPGAQKYKKRKMVAENLICSGVHLTSKKHCDNIRKYPRRSTINPVFQQLDQFHRENTTNDEKCKLQIQLW